MKDEVKICKLPSCNIELIIEHQLNKLFCCILHSEMYRSVLYNIENNTHLSLKKLNDIEFMLNYNTIKNEKEND